MGQHGKRCDDDAEERTIVVRIENSKGYWAYNEV